MGQVDIRSYMFSFYSTKTFDIEISIYLAKLSIQNRYLGIENE